MRSDFRINKIKKALLIYPKPQEIKRFRFGYSLGLLRIGALLIKAGYNVEYLDFGLNSYTEAEVLKKVNDSHLIVFEFDTFSLRRSINYIEGEKLIKSIRRKFNGEKIILVCGNDLVIVPRNVQGANYTLKKDCFHVIEDLINILQLEFTTEINNLLPERALLPDGTEFGKNIFHKPNLAKSAITKTSFGCNGNCIFCQRKGYVPHFFTLTRKFIVNDFEFLLKHNYKNIWIADDNFSSNLKEAKEILKLIIQLKSKLGNRPKIAISSWVKIDKEFLDLSKEAGVSVISFGIESANKDIQRFYNKIINLKKLENLLMYCDEVGIYTIGNFIIGAPMETKQTIAETIDFINNTPLHNINVKVLDYMVGSHLFKLLPSNLKRMVLPERHIFACKRLGLTNFYYEELKTISIDIREKFFQKNKERLENRITKHGYPYYGR